MRECRGAAGDGEAEAARICYDLANALQGHQLHDPDGRQNTTTGEGIVIQSGKHKLGERVGAGGTTDNPREQGNLTFSTFGNRPAAVCSVLLSGDTKTRSGLSSILDCEVALT
jgi:hypothetical protein